jgi:hypothetical protein
LCAHVVIRRLRMGYANDMRKDKASWKLAAYLSVGIALLVFLAGLIPAMFLGDGSMALASLVLIFVFLIGALTAGRYAFGGERGYRKPSETDEARSSITPEHMDFDDENWLRVHGGPGYQRRERDEAKRREKENGREGRRK